MAEVRAEGGCTKFAFQAHEQIACAAAKVQNAAARSNFVPQSTDCAASPVAVEIERKEMVEKVVVARNAAEHGPDPCRRLLLVRDALRSRSGCSAGHLRECAARRNGQRLFD